MAQARTVVIGAGMGGLAAAIDLASHGVAVTVLERAEDPGGKMRVARVGGHEIDAGPTVFTLRFVFEALFADAGADFAARAPLARADLLARHHWQDGSSLDLFADEERSLGAISAFAGPRQAEGFQRFRADARAVFEALWPSFMAAQQPSPLGLAAGLGAGGLATLARLQPHRSLWGALGGYFTEPRLRQLFARYATYCGASPFAAPATLMLIAHAELAGVWRLAGGMASLARAMADLAREQGATLLFGRSAVRIETNADGACAVWDDAGERHAGRAILANSDPGAISGGLLGEAVARAVTPPRERSQSAITWAGLARPEGFDLAHHTVFFSDAYREEFNDVFRRRRPPRAPTVYVCAQDRFDAPGAPLGGALRQSAAAGGQPLERLFVLANAPANPALQKQEIDQCQEAVFSRLAQAGLALKTAPSDMIRTDPADFAAAFPGSAGALYGAAIHSPLAIFQRPGAASRIPRLYLAGGGAHPSAGAPMAVLSGRLAASRILQDLGLTVRSNLGAMRGGT